MTADALHATLCAGAPRPRLTALLSVGHVGASLTTSADRVREHLLERLDARVIGGRVVVSRNSTIADGHDG